MTSIKHHVTIESVEDEGEKRIDDVASPRSQRINLVEMMSGYDFEGEAPSDRMTSWVSESPKSGDKQLILSLVHVSARGGCP